MPWQGSAPNKSFTRSNGTHSGSSAWAEDEAAGTGITSARHDVHDEDLADAIDATLLKDGGNKMAGLIDAGGFGFSNLATLGSAAEVTIASSSTTDLLGSAALFNVISGTTTITSLGTGTNRVKVARFSGALTLTHNSTSLILPGGANIVTAAGDVMIVVSDGSSNARVVSYQRAAVVPLQNSIPYAPGLVLLTSGTVSSAATLDLVLTSYTAYRGFKLALAGFVPATDDVQLRVRFSSDGGSNYDSSGYNYANWSVMDYGVYGSSTLGSEAFIPLNISSTGDGVGNASTEGWEGEIRFLNLTSSSVWSRLRFDAYYISAKATPAGTHVVGGGAREAAQDTDAIRLYFSSGNIASGKYALYGYV